MSMPNSPFSFEMLGSELDRFLSGLGAQASEYLSAANLSAGEFKTTLKNVMPRLAGDFAVDLTENDTNYIIICELPGVAKENISIKLLNPTTVLIKTNIDEGLEVATELPAEEGEVPENAPIKTTTYHLHEIKNQSRQRTVLLPADATAKGAKATFNNGILELILPKTDPEEGIAIEIE